QVDDAVDREQQRRREEDPGRPEQRAGVPGPNLGAGAPPELTPVCDEEAPGTAADPRSRRGSSRSYRGGMGHGAGGNSLERVLRGAVAALLACGDVEVEPHDAREVAEKPLPPQAVRVVVEVPDVDPDLGEAVKQP